MVRRGMAGKGNIIIDQSLIWCGLWVKALYCTCFQAWLYQTEPRASAARNFFFFFVNIPFLSDHPCCARGCNASICSFQTSPPGESRTACEWTDLNTNRLKPPIPNVFEYCLMLVPPRTMSEATSFTHRPGSASSALELEGFHRVRGVLWDKNCCLS